MRSFRESLRSSCCVGIFFLGLIFATTQANAQDLTVHGDCNDGQRSRMEHSFIIAQSAIRVALTEIRPESALFQRWFGPWSDAKGNVVRYFLDKASRAEIEFRCGSSSVLFAFDHVCDPAYLGHYRNVVYQTRFYVCDQWHSLPPLSLSLKFDANRAGVIVHEMLHGVGTLTRNIINLDTGLLDVVDRSSCGHVKDNKCYGLTATLALASDPTCYDLDDEPIIVPSVRGEAVAISDGSCKALYNSDNYAMFASDVLLNTILYLM
jgi:hypothetical protein